MKRALVCGFPHLDLPIDPALPVGAGDVEFQLGLAASPGFTESSRH